MSTFSKQSTTTTDPAGSGDALTVTAPAPVVDGAPAANRPSASGSQHAPSGAPRATSAPRARPVTRVLEHYGLIGVWAVMAVAFVIASPGSFAKTATLQSIFGSQSVLLILAMAAVSTFVVGEFDLSFAAVLGLSGTIVPVLVTEHGVNIGVACLVALFTGVACGVLNAVFIVLLGVPSLVVTLGSASLFLGITELISSSNTVSVSNPTFTKLTQTQVFGLPVSLFYGLTIALIFAYLLAWTPIGRHLLFVGASRNVARLSGINVDRIRFGAYVWAGLLAALAGVVLVSSVGGIDPGGSSNYLLPALAATFLGTAVVAPGQFNPLGTVVGIFFLETGVFGLQILGFTGWVQDAFYGGGLILAVTAATLIKKHAATR